jgi:hypothetical protein
MQRTHVKNETDKQTAMAWATREQAERRESRKRRLGAAMAKISIKMNAFKGLQNKKQDA